MQKVPLYKERNEVAPGREGEGQRGRGRPREVGAGYPDDCVFTAAPSKLSIICILSQASSLKHFVKSLNELT